MTEPRPSYTETPRQSTGWDDDFYTADEMELMVADIQRQIAELRREERIKAQQDRMTNFGGYGRHQTPRRPPKPRTAQEKAEAWAKYCLRQEMHRQIWEAAMGQPLREQLAAPAILFTWERTP